MIWSKKDVEIVCGDLVPLHGLLEQLEIAHIVVGGLASAQAGEVYAARQVFLENLAERHAFAQILHRLNWALDSLVYPGDHRRSRKGLLFRLYHLNLNIQQIAFTTVMAYNSFLRICPDISSTRLGLASARLSLMPIPLLSGHRSLLDFIFNLL
jgi:hypothetical protein